MDLNTLDRFLFLRTKQGVSWTNVRVTKETGIVLSSMKFRDFVFARYNVTRP